MAFTNNILSWRFCHLHIVGCLLKGRPTKGGSRAPQAPPPPSYAPALSVVRTTMSVAKIYSVGCMHYSVGCKHFVKFTENIGLPAI